MSDDKPKRHRCVSCRKLFPSGEIVRGPCPYAQDIDGDETPVWLCQVCRQNKADDI